MDENDIGMGIKISAFADESSAVTATKDLQKQVLKTTDGGEISIPVKIITPIKGESKKLEKARKDLISQWNNAVYSGSFLSEESIEQDLDSLNGLRGVYKNFTGLVRTENKQSSKSYRALIQEMKSYMSMINSINKRVQVNSAIKETKTNNTSTKTKNKNKKSNSKNTSYEDNIINSDGRKVTVSKEERAKAIKQYKLDVAEARKEKDIAKYNPGNSTPNSIATSDTLRASDVGGAYAVKSATAQAIAYKEEYQKSIASLRLFKKTPDDFAQYITGRGTELDSNDATSEQRENKKAFKTTMYDSIKDNFAGLLKGTEDASVDKLIDSITTALNIDAADDIAPSKSLLKINNQLMRPYDSGKGRIGVEYENKEGRMLNKDEAEQSLKDIFKTMSSVIDTMETDYLKKIQDRSVFNSITYGKDAQKELNQRSFSKKNQEVDNQVNEVQRLLSSGKITEEVVNVLEKLGVSLEQLELDSATGTLTSAATEMVTALNEIKTSSDNLTSDTQETTEDTKILRELQGVLTRQYNSDISASSKEAIADKQIADTLKTDASTGFNANEVTNKVVSVFDTISNANKLMSEYLESINTSCYNLRYLESGKTKIGGTPPSDTPRTALEDYEKARKKYENAKANSELRTTIASDKRTTATALAKKADRAEKNAKTKPKSKTKTKAAIEAREAANKADISAQETATIAEQYAEIMRTAELTMSSELDNLEKVNAKYDKRTKAETKAGRGLIPKIYETTDEKGNSIKSTVVDKTEEAYPNVTHFQDKTDTEKLHNLHVSRALDAEYEDSIKQNARNKMYTSTVYQSKTDPSETENKLFMNMLKSLQNVFTNQTEVDRINTMNQQEQEMARAKRLETFGISKGKELSETGDIINVKRTKTTFGGNNSFFGDLKSKILQQDVPGTDTLKDADYENLFKSINKTLSGREMYKAQTGGGFLKNTLGSMTMYLGQDSLEKSRVQADALNEILANLGNEAAAAFEDIRSKEVALRGMANLGTANFDNKGRLIEETSSPAANDTYVKLEEQKSVMRALASEAGAVNAVVNQSGGKISKIFKQLGFFMPELRQNNVIIKNINAGLDKSGKALKFQSRTAEVMSYSFQLMARQVGTMVKNWMLQLNPLYQIRKLFSEFASYDVKWQRTFNVITYNFHAIIEPFMEWIAQELTNVIGFLDIISMKIQEAFGSIPISLFDQASAESQQIAENLEDASNTTASFDELHDISSTSDADDLSGDIYTPELSEEWIALAERIGDLFAGIITGDLGFGDVAAEILGIAGQTLVTLASDIWNWAEDLGLVEWFTDGWDKLLATLLTAFLGWQLLKVAGTLIYNAMFGTLAGSAATNIFSSLWASLGSSTFGSQLQVGILQAFTGNGLIGALKAGGASLGSVLAQAIIGVISVALTAFFINFGVSSLIEDTEYNAGVTSAGGTEDDHTSSLGTSVLSVLGSAATGAIAGATVGGIPGAAIGAILATWASTVALVLTPALTEASVEAKSLSGELQSIAYYEGSTAIYGAQVDELTELMSVLNATLEDQKEKVYSLGEEYGISSERMTELVNSALDGTYSIDMLSASELALSDSLLQLQYQQEKSTETSEALTLANEKLALEQFKAGIAADIAAGSFELASAKVNQALLAETITGEESAQLMTSILEQANTDMKTYLLEDMSPAIKAQWEEYVTTTDEGKAQLTEMYKEMNEEEREAFSKSYEDEAGSAMAKTLQGIQDELDLTTFDWSHPFKSLGSIISGDWGWKSEDVASFDVGTNYVPNDGLAYIHKGEAIIPASENVFASQGSAWESQSMTNSQMMSAISNLENLMKQGITVNGEFTQRGSDLVAVVNKTNSQTGGNLLSNVSYAR